jgi:peptidoglycan hydrolase-like protein with peptidoglycan-binding domain
MSRRSTKVVMVVAFVGLAGAAVLVVTNSRAGSTGTPPVTGVSTGTAAVRRVDIAERQQIGGTLGYEGAYNVIAPGPGVLTRLPAVGEVVRRGQAIYEIDGRPVVLMYGVRPAWRPIEPGMTDGADVQQLETNLKELGYGAGLTIDQHFNVATATAIRRWQQAVHLTVTGSVPVGQVVFMPDPVRIGAHDLRLGEQVDPGALVERGTSDKPAITIALSPQQLPTAKVGDRVVVTMPDGKTRDGHIAHIGAVATSGGDTNSGNGNGNGNGDSQSHPTAPVTVQVDGATSGFLDQSAVQVAITVESHPHILAVPITALNALPDGAYEVIVVDGGSTRRIHVQTGLFDEIAGLAEVSGPGLAEGQKVEVPE